MKNDAGRRQIAACNRPVLELPQSPLQPEADRARWRARPQWSPSAHDPLAGRVIGASYQRWPSGVNAGSFGGHGGGKRWRPLRGPLIVERQGLGDSVTARRPCPVRAP